ncbi:MAG: polysaccharide biosynthesis/export family protein [Pseudomonadota bacterium]
MSKLIGLLVSAGIVLASASAPAFATESYRVQPGDLLTISVWKERDLQGDILVRPDGGLSFPLAGDVNADGKTTQELTDALAAKLKRYIPDPVVTVSVKQIGGNRIYVLGKVSRPGEFMFSKPVDVMQALALAGGATPFAEVNDIRILRREGGVVRSLTFKYAEVERGKELAQNVLLQSGDTVVVP